MNNTILGLTLLGISVIAIIGYFTKVISYYTIAKNISTDSKGIKRLKFQEKNDVWNKFVKYK